MSTEIIEYIVVIVMITRYLKCLATSQVDCTLCLWVEHKLSEHLPIWHCFVVFRPSVHLSHFTSTKQYLLNYSVHSYHQKVKIIKQILTFVVRWIRDNIFQAKDVFTSHARWIRLLLEKYYHVFTSTKVNICMILTAEKWYWPIGLCDVISHTALVDSQNFMFWLFFTMVNRRRAPAKMLSWQCGGIVADINNYFRHGNGNWLYVGVSIILSLASIITTDIAM